MSEDRDLWSVGPIRARSSDPGAHSLASSRVMWEAWSIAQMCHYAPRHPGKHSPMGGAKLEIEQLPLPKEVHTGITEDVLFEWELPK